MPTFHYLAKKGPKDLIEGVFEAESRTNVLSHLEGLGYTPVQIVEAGSGELISASAAVPLRRLRIPARQFNQFTRQFASLVRSQVPLLRALAILKEQSSHPKLQWLLEAVGEDIRQGQTLSGALERYPLVFSPLYISLIQAGEAAGMLDTVLDRLAAQADQEEALRAKVQGALVYPLFVGVVGLGTVIFLLAFVMPRLVKLFKGFGGHLPLPTRMLLTLSGWMSQEWVWVFFAVAVLAMTVFVRGLGEKGRFAWDRFSLRLPWLGNLFRQIELARFSRSFGLLLDHGVPILRATEIAVPVVEHRVIRQQLGRLTARLKEGNSLSSCLKGLSVATPFMVNTVAVGEEGGKVGEALMEVASFYEREIERLLHTMAALLEPAMILVVGAVVGFIVMAVLLPVFEMSSIVK